VRAVDTNVFVRLIVCDDPKQVEAAEAFARHGVWVSQIVLNRDRVGFGLGL